MSEKYIKNHFGDIKKYASSVEDRLDDVDCTLESVLEDNKNYLEGAKKYDLNCVFIEYEYKIDI